MQDVFLTLWSNPRQFDPRRGSLPGYVAMMARSRAVDRMRSLAAGRAATERLGYRDEERASGREDAASDLAIRRDETERALRAVGDLPASQREAVLLAFGRGLSASEIAATSAVPLGTAKSRLRLGLEKAHGALSSAA